MSIGSIILLGITANLLTAIHATDEHVLIQKLLKDYEKAGAIYARPVWNVTDTLIVKFGMALIKIHLDEDAAGPSYSTLTASVWLRYTWNDVFLKWDPEKYGGVDHIRLPSDKVWKPDIKLYNGNSAIKYDTSALVVVSCDGAVMWIPPATITTECDDFNDMVGCMWKFGSWTYDGFKMDIDFYNNMENIDVYDFIESRYLELVETKGEKNVKYYPCCEEPYPDLTFSMTLKKHDIPAY